MDQYIWQLTAPVNTIIFDCDGTLSAIEGIDKLAEVNGASEVVKALTAVAMGQLGMNLELYEKRLEIVQPTQAAVNHLADQYYAHRTPDIEAVIDLLKSFNKTIYILSAGLLPSVVAFGKRLGIPEANIIAVDIEFDKNGNYKDFDRASPLVTSNGKRIIISQLKARHPEMILVGDGLNDWVANDLVHRFVGYGGAYYRENIASQCQFYISARPMSSLLPLCLTATEVQLLNSEQEQLYLQGMRAIEANEVAIS